MAFSIADDLLIPARVREVRLDLTTRCNLRCVYCAVSQSTYRGEDMPMDNARHAVGMVAELARFHKPDAVHVNGHGETTFMSGWIELCNRLLAEDLFLWMTTNLAKRYSEEELDVLSRMSVIMVSIDTADARLLRRLRRKVDLNQIISNIAAIRAASERNDRPQPKFRFSCGLYDQNSPTIEGLAHLAVELNIDAVGFWNLTTWSFDSFPYELTDVPQQDRAFPLDQLSDEELWPRIEAIRRAIAILERNRIGVHTNGDFINILAIRVARTADSGTTEAPALSYSVPDGTTRDCIDPWTYFELGTDGHVRPCCAHSSIGNLSRASLAEILHGEPIRRLRHNLITGNLDEDCRNCRIRGTTAPSDLLKTVNELSEEGLFLRAQQVESMLRQASEHLSAGRSEEAWTAAAGALELDPGLPRPIQRNSAMIREHLPAIVNGARFPLTLSGLADISRRTGDTDTCHALLRAYLKLAPDAPDRETVLQWLPEEPSLLYKMRANLKNFPSRGWLWFRQRVRLRTRLHWYS